MRTGYGKARRTGLFEVGGAFGITSAGKVCGTRFRQRNRSDSGPSESVNRTLDTTGH